MLRHTTNTLLPDAATCGKSSSSASLLTLTGLLKLAPLSVLLTRNISDAGPLRNTTSRFPLDAAISAGLVPHPTPLLRLIGLLKLAPLSALRTNNTLQPVPHITNMLLPDVIIFG